MMNPPLPEDSRRDCPPWLPWAGLLLVLILTLAVGLFAVLRAETATGEEVAATAVASILLTATAQATPAVTPTIALPTPTPTPRILPATCADIRARQPNAGDGEYTLFVGGDGRFPLTLYCHDMRANPREYLTLPNSSANYALIAYPEGALITRYQKVRLNPTSLVVEVADYTFSTTQEPLSGYVPIAPDSLANYPILRSNYAHALGCNRGAVGAPPGAAAIDLSDTPLALADSVQFSASGTEVGAFTADISPDRQRATLQVDGRCGLLAPVGSLSLAYVP